MKPKDADPEYISVLSHVEEASAEYTMWMFADHWGPQGKPDQGGAPKMLYTKMELNNLVQQQVSAALKQFKTQQSMDKTNESSYPLEPRIKTSAQHPH